MTRGVQDAVLQENAPVSDRESPDGPAATIARGCQSAPHRRLMFAERRVIALCAGSYSRSWIEAEVADLVGARVYVEAMHELVAALGRGGASRHELLVLDLDRLQAAELRDLQAAIETRWWNGMIVGLGAVRGIHRRYLEIERVIPRPLGSEALRAIVEKMDPDRRDTQPMIERVADIERRR